MEFGEPAHAETAKMLHGTELGDMKLNVEDTSPDIAKEMLQKEEGTKKAMTEYERAIAKMHDMMKDPKDGTAARNDEVKRTVYVGNLSKHCTPQHLKEEFNTVGEVVYIKFSGNVDFRYAFIEFATEEQARKAFTFHGKVIAGQSIKVGTAHNPIFKDDVNSEVAESENSRRFKDDRDRSRRRRRRSRSRSRSRDRGRRRRRKKKKRRRRSRSGSDEEEEKPKMFWDGYQWHFNDATADDIEEQVTSIIRNDNDPQEPEDSVKKMENAAQEALKALQISRGFR